MTRKFIILARRILRKIENSSEIGEWEEGQADADADDSARSKIKEKAAPSTKSSDVRSARLVIEYHE